MTLRLIAFAIGTAALAACATTPTQSPAAPQAQTADARIDIRTAPETGVFEIALTNRGNQDLCLAVGDWPNQDFWGKEATPRGSLHQASSWVYASVGDDRFPVEEDNLGYCDPSVTDLQGRSVCHVVFEAGQTRTATLPYARFPGLLQASVAGEPQLTYAPELTACP